MEKKSSLLGLAALCALSAFLLVIGIIVQIVNLDKYFEAEAPQICNVVSAAFLLITIIGFAIYLVNKQTNILKDINPLIDLGLLFALALAVIMILISGLTNIDGKHDSATELGLDLTTRYAVMYIPLFIGFIKLIKMNKPIGSYLCFGMFIAGAITSELYNIINKEYLEHYLSIWFEGVLKTLAMVLFGIAAVKFAGKMQKNSLPEEEASTGNGSMFKDFIDKIK